jgi:hypothetical protein
MDQPVYWTVLLGVVALAATARAAARRPLLPGRAVPLRRGELVVAGVAGLGLVFHCAAMFFAPWTDALPGGRPLGEAVRELGPASQWAYWLPAVALVVALRRVWWPGVVLLVGTLAGVGVTMYWSAPLTTHLAWLAAAVLTVSFVVVALLVPRVRGGRPGRPTEPRLA